MKTPTPVSLLLILISFSGVLSETNLQQKVLVFPAESDSASVVLQASLLEPLTSFTVCLRYYSLLTREYSLFSYATKEQYNQILVLKPKPNQYRLYLGAVDVTFILPEKKDSKPGWEHICVSWESATGLVALWLDGEPLPRMGLQKSQCIHPEASIVLGQDQDSFGGGFDASQSFVGEMKDVYMWNRVLNADEVGLVLSDYVLSDSLINWRALNYEIKGYVVLQPCQTPSPYGVQS
uniref:Pentraxin family member n=1 Tax=Anolis carolinensis TaxID=28377 RepID=A0A803TXI2_ANOCA|nr:PREDICTED: C-reactive protein-like [Anolis carolinensis]|eukprot:XP_008120254.1 PREDICTED: C-reactive protein-like [Anolis carolinensis]